MNDAQIAQLLRQRNPWWTSELNWEQDDPHLREVADAPFDYRPETLANIEVPGLYLMIGPRRVGKSVELRRAIAHAIELGVDRRRVIYCSCDDFRVQDLRRLFTVGRNLTPTVKEPRYWFVDEVTAVRGDWSAVIKDLRGDTPLRDDCVVLTGSSARGFREAIKNLAGRRGKAANSDRVLLPMGFRDFCVALGGLDTVPAYPPVRPKDLQSKTARDAVTELSYWTEQLTAAWELYLYVGGFPRSLTDYLNHGEVQAGFVNDLWDVLRADAITLASMSDAQVLAMLDRLNQSLTTPLNASSVATDLGLADNHAVNARIEHLTVAFLTWRCYQLINGNPSVKARRKVYFIDPLLARLASLKSDAYQAPDLTKMSEQQLGLALARAVQREHPRSFVEAQAVFYEVPTGKEIDFVGPHLEMPFESKYTDKQLKQEALTAQAAYQRGVLASHTVLDTSDPVWIIPTAILAWLLE